MLGYAEQIQRNLIHFLVTGVDRENDGWKGRAESLAQYGAHVDCDTSESLRAGQWGWQMTFDSVVGAVEFHRTWGDHLAEFNLISTVESFDQRCRVAVRLRD